MIHEAWRDIEGYEGLYKVSNIGRVRSTPRTFTKGGILRIYKAGAGYLKLTLTKNGRQQQFYVHRLVARAFAPNPDNLPQINHIDGDKENNHINNLEWCNSADNMRHAWSNKLIGNCVCCGRLSTKSYCDRHSLETAHV